MAFSLVVKPAKPVLGRRGSVFCATREVTVSMSAGRGPSINLNSESSPFPFDSPATHFPNGADRDPVAAATRRRLLLHPTSLANRGYVQAMFNLVNGICGAGGEGKLHAGDRIWHRQHRGRVCLVHHHVEVVGVGSWEAGDENENPRHTQYYFFLGITIV